MADDGNFEASAEEERFLIDDAMVGDEDGAGVTGISGEVSVGIRKVGGEAEVDRFVRLAAGGDAGVWGGRHCFCLLRHEWNSCPSQNLFVCLTFVPTRNKVPQT